MHRGWRFAVACAIVVLIINGALRDGQRGSAQHPPWWSTNPVEVRYLPREPPLLPSEWMRSPETELRDGPLSEWSHGTAFSIDDQGGYVTAAHVTAGCSQLALVSEQALATHTLAATSVVTEMVLHVSADASAVRTPLRAPPIDTAGDVQPQPGMVAYGYGYPHGEPGALRGEFVGRARGRAQSRPGAFPLFVWAMTQREPASEQPLGGISGGPLLSAAGQVIGMVIGYPSERRSLFVTTTMAPVREVSEIADNDHGSGFYHTPVPDAQFAAYGAQLRKQGSVVPIVCHRALATGAPTSGARRRGAN